MTTQEPIPQPSTEAPKTKWGLYAGLGASVVAGIGAGIFFASGAENLHNERMGIHAERDVHCLEAVQRLGSQAVVQASELSRSERIGCYGYDVIERAKDAANRSLDYPGSPDNPTAHADVDGTTITLVLPEKNELEGQLLQHRSDADDFNHAEVVEGAVVGALSLPLAFGLAYRKLGQWRAKRRTLSADSSNN